MMIMRRSQSGLLRGRSNGARSRVGLLGLAVLATAGLLASLPTGFPGAMATPGMGGKMPGQMPPGMPPGMMPADREPAGASPADAPAAAAARATAPQRYWLDNGIEVLMLPDPASRIVTSMVVIKTGSAWETLQSSGASHFLEHMLFNGTERRTQEELYAATDFYGAFNNAFTRRTHVAFMMAVAEPYLGRALDLQADMLLRSTIPADHFEKERGIIMEELAKDLASGVYQRDRLLQAETYPGCGYGLPVLGTAGSLEVLSRDTVTDFYERNYIPERMQVVLLGGFDPSVARDSLAHYWGAAAAAGVRFEAPPAPPPIDATRYIEHALPLPQARLRIVWDAPAPGDPDYLAAEAAVALLASDDASPLAQAVKGQHPDWIQSWGMGLAGGYGFGRLILDLDLAPGAPLREIAATVTAAWGRLPEISAERLAAWQTAQRAAQLYARQRSYMFAPLTAHIAALEGLWALERRVPRIAELTAAEVALAAGRLGRGANLQIAIEALSPTAAGAQAARGAAPVSAAAAGETAAVLAPYSVTDTLLASGTHLLWLETPPSGVLSAYVLIEGRNYLERRGEHGATEMLHTLMGTATDGYDEAALTAALEAVGAELQTADRAFLPFDDRYTRRDFSFLRFQCLEEYAAEGIGLLAEMLHQPRLDPGLIERTRSAMLARLAREAGQAQTQAWRLLRERLYGAEHPEARSPYGDSLSLEGLTAADLAAYHERLLDPRRVWIAISSALPREDVVAFAERIAPEAGASSPRLGFSPEQWELWQAREQLAAQAALHLAQLGGERRVERVRGFEQGYVIEAVLLPAGLGDVESAAASDASRDRAHLPAARIATALLSADLAFELRERQGLAYSIGAGLTPIGDRWLYLARAGTRPENAAAMAAGFREAREGAGALAGARAAQREANAIFGRELRRQEIRVNQAMEAVWSARAGRDPLAWWHAADQLAGAELEAVRRVLRTLARAPKETTLEVIVK